MELNNYDKERLKAKYEKFCYDLKIDSDLFDIDANIDSSLTYWENWGIIEDKLNELTPQLITKQLLKKPVEIEVKQHKINFNPLIIDLDKTDSIAILGDRQQGKTNMAFYLLNNYRGVKNVCLYGYPKNFPGFKNLSSWTDLLKLTDSIIFIDEIQRYIKLYDRRANNELLDLMSFLSHQNNTLIFSTQLSQFITKGVEASIQTWLIKKLDIAGLKNGCKAKRLLTQIADARITDKGMALDVNEVIAFDSMQPIGFNGVKTFEFQNVGKDWKTPNKNSEKIPTITATITANNMPTMKKGKIL